MPLNKEQLNARLRYNQTSQPFGQEVNGAANLLKENNFAKNATLLGDGPGSTHAGIESLESKVDNAGSTSLGDAMCSFGDEVTGISGVPDPQKVELDLSVPVFTVSSNTPSSDSDAVETTITAGATESQPVSSVVQQLTGLGAPVAKLDTQTLGGSSLDAIDATASDATGKSNVLKEKIQGVAAETKSASGTGGGASGGLGAVTGALKKAGDMISEVAKEVSSIPSINVDAPELSNVTNAVGHIDVPSTPNLNSIETPLDKLVDEVSNNINPSLTELEKSQTGLDDFFNRPKVKTGLGLIQDIVEDITNDVTSKIRIFTSNARLPLEEVSEITSNALGLKKEDRFKASQDIIRKDTTFSSDMKSVIGKIPDGLDNNTFVDTLNVKARSAQIPQTEINQVEQRLFQVSDKLQELDTTISGTLIKSADDFVTEEYDLSNTLAKFDGQQTTFDTFTYVDSKEELGAEFRKIKRVITSMIIHASDTYTNQNIGSEELHIEHNDKDLDGLQYHYVIRRDGKLQRGRPLDTVGESSKVNGHAQRSVDVCLVGGLNCSTGCENPDQYRSSQSFTREQMTTLESICEAFYRRYHGGQVFGHNEIEPLNTDPYFDVSLYVETLFRKSSVYEDLLIDQALSPDELITKKPQ
jgi:N-acetylmuramoyl-L-alanine amidase